MLMILLTACSGRGERVLPGNADLSVPLVQGEARAGLIDDETLLFGGISAEGQLGDALLKNDRVQFVIQGAREGSFYLAPGGGLIDADVVRGEGEPGFDAVDEWTGMFGIGRMMDAVSVFVADDGEASGEAIVIAEGREAPIELFTGSVETPGLIPDLGLHLSTQYRLRADSWLLEVTTILTATKDDVVIQPGDLLMGSLDALDGWEPGGGFQPLEAERPLSGFIAKNNSVALALIAAPGASLSVGGLAVLVEEAEMTIGFGEPLTIPSGRAATWTRYYGVASDMATLTDAMLVLRGAASQTVSGVVSAPDGSVAGTRVVILVDEDPWTVAVTDDEGAFSAQAPAEAEVRAVAVGRGHGYSHDLPPDAGLYSPYAAEPARELTIASFAGEADPPTFEGRGVGTPDAPLTLSEPARITITSADGLPFEARAVFTDGDPVSVDTRWVPDRPDHYAAVGWSRDGSLTLAVETADLTIHVHRGIRYEVWSTTLTDLEPGEEILLEAELTQAYSHEGWMLGDPHVHAAPSGDGSVPMEHRLIGLAGMGIQLHFGTDHDHVADYRPLLEPLGLDGVLNSVVADEMSPVLRGHMNLYPLESDPSQPNGGAWPWWSEPIRSTSEQMEILRERHPAAMVQVNHPTSKGLANAAGWSEGEIERGDFFTQDFDIVEVLNSGDTDDFLSFYLDCLNRGILAAPVGVSDTHSRLSGKVGLSATFIGLGSDAPSDYTDDGLREAMSARRTVVTRGPFLALDVDPGSVVVGSTELSVEARSPSWIRVDRLRLLRDGVAIETVDGTSASFTLAPESDASYIIIAEGDTPMSPIYADRTPWAMSSPILVDIDGDGWDAPLPPMSIPE